MKALIVDDELHVREAIQLLVDWDAYGIERVFEAEDGATAVELIERERPEIIFTDMIMPIMSGGELLRWIANHAAESKTIVISGHEDFEFVRLTVKYGGQDYILKPIDETQLVDALKKAIKSWEEDEQVRSRNRQFSLAMNRMKPVYCEKLFSDLIFDPHSYPAASRELEQDFGLHPGVKQCRAAAISLNLIAPAISSKFGRHRDLLFFSLVNICNEFLRPSGIGFAFRLWNREHEIVVLFWDRLEQVEQVIREMNDGICLVLKSRFTFGLGTVQPFPSGLERSYNEADISLRKRNLLLQQTRIVAFDGEEAALSPSLFFSDVEQELRTAVQSGNAGQISSALQPWFARLSALDRITLEMLEQWWNEWKLMRSQWIKEWLGGSEPSAAVLSLIEEPLSVPIDELGHFRLADWYSALVGQAVEFARLMSDLQHKDRSVIAEIARYLQQHYAEDITLQDITDRFFLSREYISRKFKQEMNENLSEYIGRIRIEKAKLLLANPYLKITQIAQMVGYQDEKYFSKVFKKLTGASPNEYKKLHFQGQQGDRIPPT